MSKCNLPRNLPTDLYDGLSDSSTEESFVLYQNMQRIPNVPQPNFKEPSRKLFTKTSPSVPRVRKSTLFKLFNTDENLLACSTPMSRSSANKQMNQNSLLDLSPIIGGTANKSVEATGLANHLAKGLQRSKNEEALPKAKKTKSINSSIRAVVEHLNSLRNNSLKENVKKKRKKSRKDNSIAKHVKTRSDHNFVSEMVRMERETQTTDSLNKGLPRGSVVLTPLVRVRRKCDDGNTTDGNKLKSSSENTHYNPMLNEFLDKFDASVSSRVPSIISISSTLENITSETTSNVPTCMNVEAEHEIVTNVTNKTGVANKCVENQKNEKSATNSKQSFQTSTGAIRKKTEKLECVIKEKTVTDEACKRDTSLLPRSEFETKCVNEVNENLARSNSSISKYQGNKEVISSLKENNIISMNMTNNKDNISKRMAIDHLSINTTNKEETPKHIDKGEITVINDKQNVSQKPIEIVEATDSTTVNVRKQPQEKRSSARIRDRSKNFPEYLSINTTNKEETPKHIDKERITVPNDKQNVSQKPIETVEATDSTTVNVRKQPEEKRSSARIRDRSKNFPEYFSINTTNKEETPKHIDKESITVPNDKQNVSQKPIETVEATDSTTVNVRKQPEERRSTARKKDQSQNLPSKSHSSSVNSKIVMSFDSTSSVTRGKQNETNYQFGLTDTTESLRKKGRPKGSKDKFPRVRRSSNQKSYKSKSHFVRRLSGFAQVTNISSDKNDRSNKKSEGRVPRQRRPPPVYVQSTLLRTSTQTKKTSELHLAKVGSAFTQNNELTLSSPLESENENHEIENENNRVENESVFKKPLPKQDVGVPKKGNSTSISKSIEILKTVHDCTTSENSQKQTDNEDVRHGIENLNDIESDFGTSTMSKDTEANTYSLVPSCSNWNDNLPVKEANHEPTRIKDSRSSNLIIHQNIAVPLLSVESNFSKKSEDHHKKKVIINNVSSCNCNTSSSPAELSFQQEVNGNTEQPNQNILYTLIDNKVVGLEWMSKMEPFNTDDSQDVTVSYALKNLKTPSCTFSCGFIKFRPGKQMEQVTKKHSVIYKVEQGQALVCVQLQRKCMEVGCSFHIPLGSHHSIENLSQAEPLILFFHKMSAA